MRAPCLVLSGIKFPFIHFQKVFDFVKPLEIVVGIKYMNVFSSIVKQI